MPKAMDVFGNVERIELFALDDAVASGDGSIVDLSRYNGIVMVKFVALEDASLANSKKLDVTIHNVADDDETTDADNLVLTFDQIVGANGSIAQKTVQLKALNLGRFPELGTSEADTLKKYLQVKLVNTSTWAGHILVEVFASGQRTLPTNTQ